MRAFSRRALYDPKGLIFRCIGTPRSAYEQGLQRGEAVIRVSATAWWKLELLGDRAHALARATRRPADRSGWVQCSIPIETIDYSARELLRFGLDLEVLEPRALCAAIARLANQLTSRYPMAGLRPAGELPVCT